MQVLVYQANQPVARAQVKIYAGVATARIITATAPSITIAQGTKVHYASADAFARNPLTSALL